MSDTPSINPAIRDIAGLAAAIGTRCPSMTHTLVERLRERGLPEGQIQEVVDAARTVCHEARIRGESMIDAVLAGDNPTSCMQAMDDTCADNAEGCCSGGTNETSCCGSPADSECCQP